MLINEKCAFHIHTFRCGHAEIIPDEAYVQKAAELGAESIWFSDHAPFPGDPFRARMKMDELNEYLDTLSSLRKKYRDTISVHIGLETEFFPSFDSAGYYKTLREDPRLEFITLGQHMAETAPGHYTFEWDRDHLVREEYLVLGEAMIAGIRSGYFDFVAHPDRIFRRRKAWDLKMQDTAELIIKAAADTGIPLEVNLHSMSCRRHFWPQFWELLAPEHPTIEGLDAHAINELIRRWQRKSCMKG